MHGATPGGMSTLHEVGATDMTAGEQRMLHPCAVEAIRHSYSQFTATNTPMLPSKIQKLRRHHRQLATPGATVTWQQCLPHSAVKPCHVTARCQACHGHTVLLLSCRNSCAANDTHPCKPTNLDSCQQPAQYPANLLQPTAAMQVHAT